MSRSVLRRIARPKTALVGAAITATAGAVVLGVNAPAASAAPAAPTVASTQAIAKKVIKDDAQYQCFNKIVDHESDWKVTATNPSSGAYGLVQALPAGKMATHGSDWRTNPETQIKWGLDYMKDRYGSPCGAWAKWQTQGWY
ncbi:aggregation-promoting factor C-terminal-like domain-containing protein [Streptomyces yaizuensis]|uniref:Transglycosylase SLT domain-containing protein n=1 Tax=Streptomyces yaizuensis TaxID=2989713 RepID=A0ABQ5NU80_9ACTN|nr:transglycosylase SLT domain-containing protein [Streptomyces sp. YSPA8]GLF93919.1 transglycosylase SLT domain-containing protein [Streptomyces sp. YSPA8]